MHAENAGHATPNACGAQEPSAGVGPVANRPPQPLNDHAILALTALIKHDRTVGEPA
jgi:hypothetical protein